MKNRIKKNDGKASIKFILAHLHKNENPTIIEKFNEFLDECRILIDSGLRREESLRKFKSLKILLIEFINLKYQQSDIEFKNVDNIFIDEFNNYIGSSRNYNVNTIQKYIKHFKHFLRFSSFGENHKSLIN